MAEETITFELIRKIQREERASPKLTKLPENFYENVKSYIEQKEEIARTKDDRKVALEAKNVKRIVEDIFNRRERKILNQALITARTSIPPENLTEEERRFFEKVLSAIMERRKSLLLKLLGEKGETINLVVFKEDVPQFVGSDGKTYGPFHKGDIARIPEDNAKLLMEKGLAEKLKVK
ncbi:hypothetical protein DRN32_07570 [Thermococci archaeon]|nr:MAG: hypothetical protein DRN32_07570 [Thermococci archaeon]